MDETPGFFQRGLSRKTLRSVMNEEHWQTCEDISLLVEELIPIEKRLRWVKIQKRYSHGPGKKSCESMFAEAHFGAVRIVRIELWGMKKSGQVELLKNGHSAKYRLTEKGSKLKKKDL